MIKKLLCLLGVCLVTTSVNASDFECTLHKIKYMAALDPLVPQLLEDLKNDDFEAIYKVETDLSAYKSEIYRNCENIKNTSELRTIVYELTLGTIKLNMEERDD